MRRGLPISGEMSVEELVLVQGMHDTKLALRRWNTRPFEVLGPWLALSLMISLGLLCAVYAVAELTTPDSTRYVIPGYTEAAGFDDYAQVLFRNSLVLALHAMACVAGFIAGSSLPLSASKRSGISRWVHDKAGPLAIAFVICATGFSLVTQAYIIGGGTASIAQQLGTTPAILLLALSPHALPGTSRSFVVPRMQRHRQKTGKPSVSIWSASRTPPSIISPATPRARAATVRISPQ